MRKTNGTKEFRKRPCTVYDEGNMRGQGGHHVQSSTRFSLRTLMTITDSFQTISLSKIFPWQSTCLPWVRLWIQSPALQRGNTTKQTNEQTKRRGHTISLKN